MRGHLLKMHRTCRTSAKGFLYGLSFYVGERVDWLGFVSREGGRRKVCLRQPVPARTALLHGPRPSRICEADERSFLACAFDYFVQPQNLQVLNWLAMIWDSADNFFPIQCLVAATVVEGLARRIVGDEWNEEERESANALKQKVTDLVRKQWATLANGHLTAVVEACQKKIPNAIKYAGGYSARELVKKAARKLGAPVTSQEIDAWVSLRNPLAHGDYGSDRPPFVEIQATSHQLDCTVNLFYKLVYGQIGYKGPFVDFSRNGWPVCGEEAEAS